MFLDLLVKCRSPGVELEVAKNKNEEERKSVNPILDKKREKLTFFRTKI